MANEFPSIWFDTFLAPDNVAPVHRELEFVQKHLPLPRFRRLLDIPCGIGRHSGPLAEIGYDVVGADRSHAALSVAQEQYPGVEFRSLDMFELGSVSDRFDAVLCLWQSFGYGTAEQNRALLADIRMILRPGGRLVLDVYNRDAAGTLPASEQQARSGGMVTTSRSWDGDRMRIELTYSGHRGVDVHEWEVFTPGGLGRVVEDAGFETRLRCAWFDADIRPSSEHLRMQFLLERA